MSELMRVPNEVYSKAAELSDEKDITMKAAVGMMCRMDKGFDVQMALSLPEDLEPFVDAFSEVHSPAVYALELNRPEDPEAAWDREYDNRPPWFEQYLKSGTVIYVGATADVLSRLEDHRNGEVRQAALLKICEIDDLRNVWVFNDKDRAFERESGIAMAMANQYSGYYVHQR